MSAKRLLAVYDLAVQPDTVDQLCLFQAAVQVLAAYFQLDKVDVCFLLNSDAPSARLPQKEMAMERALHLLPCVQFVPGLGSVFIREESGQLQSLLAGQNYAEIWPPMGFGQDLRFSALELLGAYFEAARTIPRPAPRQVMLAWSRDFYAAHVLPAVPVTVSIDVSASNPAVWVDFFHHCQGRYPVKFILLADPAAEVQPLRRLPNVIIAADYFINLEQEITLIITAMTHLGSHTPQAEVANLAGQLLTMFDFPAGPSFPAGMLLDGGAYRRYGFAPAAQRLWPVPAQAELLITEFERIWASLNPAEWLARQQAPAQPAPDVAMWLR